MHDWIRRLNGLELLSTGLHVFEVYLSLAGIAFKTTTPVQGFEEKEKKNTAQIELMRETYQTRALTTRP